MIKCKRCFKTYEASDPECPRCGKINEQEDISIGLTKEKKKFTFSHYKCKFCGKTLQNNQSNCSACMSSSYVNKRENPNFISHRRLDEIIYEIFRDSRYKVDMLKVFKKLELLNFDIDNWQPPTAYEYGSKMPTKTVFLAVVTSFSFSFISLIIGKTKLSDSYGLMVVLILTTILSFFLKNKAICDGLSVSKLSTHEEASITHFTRNKKNVTKEVYKLWSFDIVSVILIYKDESLYSIKFIEKIDVIEKTHLVETVAYEESMEFLRLLLLFCLKYNIDMYTQEVGDERYQKSS